jgi:hypothetical protein
MHPLDPVCVELESEVQEEQAWAEESINLGLNQGKLRCI